MYVEYQFCLVAFSLLRVLYCMWLLVQIAILKLRTLHRILTHSLQKVNLTGYDDVTCTV